MENNVNPIPEENVQQRENTAPATEQTPQVPVSQAQPECSAEMPQPLQIPVPQPVQIQPQAVPVMQIQPGQMQPIQPAQPVYQVIPAPQPAKKKKKKGWKIALGVVAGLIALVAAGIFAVYFTAYGLYDNGEYGVARKCFDFLGGFLKSEEMVDQCDYSMAGKYAEDGNYEAAWELYDSISEFKDSEQLASEARYNRAQELFDEENYDEAEEIFLLLDDYSDSEQRVIDCKMCKGVQLYRDGEYDEAREIMGDYYKKNDTARIYVTLCTYRDYEGSGASLTMTRVLYDLLADDYDDNEDVREALESPFFYLARLFDAGWKCGDYFIDANYAGDTSSIESDVPWDTPDKGTWWAFSDSAGLHMCVEKKWWFTVVGFSSYDEYHPAKMLVIGNNGEEYIFNKYTEFAEEA